MNRISFPQLVRLLSWIGDLFLLALALALLIVQGSNLTTGMAAVLVLAVIGGGMLPIAVYFIEHLQRVQAARAAEVKAPETLRQALAEMERLVTRVETAASDASKATLAARQVPSLLQEGSDSLEAAVVRLDQVNQGLKNLPDTESLAALSASPAGTVDLGPLTEKMEELKASLAASPDLGGLEKMIGELRGDLEQALVVREDKQEALLEQLEELAEALANLSAGGHAAPAAGPDPTTAPAPEVPPRAEHPVHPEAPVQTAAAPAPDVPSQPEMPPPAAPAKDEGDGAGKEGAPGGEASPAAKPAQKKARKAAARKTARKSAAKKAAGGAAGDPGGTAAPGDLFGQSVPTSGLPPGRATLLVKALVGVNNRVYVRGDPPLRWDHGRPLEATGIGEWRLELSELQDDLEVEIRLNDEVAAKGPPLVLHPGQVTQHAATFPPPGDPF